MSFQTANNDIILRDEDDTVVFNTAMRMPQILQMKQGTINSANKFSSEGGFDGYTRQYDLGTVPAGANFVLGSANYSIADGGPGGNAVFTRTVPNSDFSATIMIEKASGTGNNPTGGGGSRLMSPVLSGGRLYVYETFWGGSDIISNIWLAFTLNYRFYIGTVQPPVPQPGPLPNMSIADRNLASYAGAAGASEVIYVDVTLSDTATPYGVTVNFATANGTGIAGTNYTATSGTLTFSNEQSSKQIPVTIKVPAAGAPFDFYINLSSPQYAILTDSQAKITCQPFIPF